MNEEKPNTDKRYYCGDGVCAWRNPAIAEKMYPNHVDCTDMTDEEFIEFLTENETKVGK